MSQICSKFSTSLLEYSDETNENVKRSYSLEGLDIHHIDVIHMDLLPENIKYLKSEFSGKKIALVFDRFGEDLIVFNSEPSLEAIQQILNCNAVEFYDYKIHNRLKATIMVDGHGRFNSEPNGFATSMLNDPRFQPFFGNVLLALNFA